ncbi:helix-turn-helix domain-containing protein [Thalassotalea euphylliae]|uniref:helix-turn-helix domain-containing protein n=1 Tax=Thalassotalea euphylliae TaxID=1655234 RepID=UPI00362F1B60
MVSVFPTVLYSCMMGMVILASLDVFTRSNERQNLFLKGILLLLMLHLVGELYISSAVYVYAPGIAGLELPFKVLLGPALYFYAHATMSPEAEIDKRVKLLSFSGPLVVIIVMLPFILLISPAEKLALASPETRDPKLWKIAVMTCLSTTAIFIFYTLLFLGMALKLHNSHLEQLMERFSDIENKSLGWFRGVLFLWGGAWLLYAAEFSLGALGVRWFGTGIVLPLFTAFALAVFIKRALNQKVLKACDKGEPKEVKPRTALLSDEKMQAISTKLELAMKEERLFLQDDLSLNKLSEAITESENHISETLSQHMHTNFFSFVNTYRIEHAKDLLLNSDMLVTSIAYEVGFKSKSTFNSAFKKLVGETPTAYKTSH